MQRQKVQGNAQLLYYAAGALAAIHEKPGIFDPEEKSSSPAVQQRVPGTIADWQTCRLTLLDLELWVADVLVPGIEACLKPNAPYFPGDHCRFCPGTAACPALLSKAQAVAEGDFDAVVSKLIRDRRRRANVSILPNCWTSGSTSCARTSRTTSNAARTSPAGGLSPRAQRAAGPTNTLSPVWRKLSSDRAAEVHKTEILSPAAMEKVITKKVGAGLWQNMSQLVEAHSSGTKLAKSEQDNFDLMEALDA